MKYRKKPVVVDATRWHRNGDHPQVVRYYRNPSDDGDRPCSHCGNLMQDHGWIDTLEGGHIVCPGDYVITGVQGERYPCKPAIFDATYERVADA